MPPPSQTCAVLCQIVSLQYFSRSSLHLLAGLSCRLFLSYGLQVVTHEVHRPSLKRLMCPAHDHFICPHFCECIYDFCPLPDPDVGPYMSLYVMLSIRFSTVVCAAASVFYVCVVNVQVSAPYIIGGSTHELYTCPFTGSRSSQKGANYYQIKLHRLIQYNFPFVVPFSHIPAAVYPLNPFSTPAHVTISHLRSLFIHPTLY